MAVSEEKLTAVKRYMRVDDDTDDDVIKALYSAAELYLSNAGVDAPEEPSELYNLAVWGLTLHYYDHRDAVGTEDGFPAGLRAVFSQLKLMGEVRRSASD